MFFSFVKYYILLFIYVKSFSKHLSAISNNGISDIDFLAIGLINTTEQISLNLNIIKFYWVIYLKADWVHVYIHLANIILIQAVRQPLKIN